MFPLSITMAVVLRGKNELKYVDDVDHRQRSLKASANTQINDRHLLSYGVGFIKETGEGSRLKSSPKTSTRYIDPWDYDKGLLVEGIDAICEMTGIRAFPSGPTSTTMLL